MYRIMVYDSQYGWVKHGNEKFYSHGEALTALTWATHQYPNDQFDLAYTPSNRKAKKKVKA